MKNKSLWSGMALIASLLLSCGKDKVDPNGIIEKTVTVNNIEVDQADVRKGYIDLYDGIVYTRAEAKANSSKIDFAYAYYNTFGNPPGFWRGFENIKELSVRRGFYIEGFSTITESQIVVADQVHYATVDDFNNIKTSTDIDKIFDQGLALHSNTAIDDGSPNDVSVGRLCAFIDKNGKKGLFMIDDYVAAVPASGSSPLTLHIKIER